MVSIIFFFTVGSFWLFLAFVALSWKQILLCFCFPYHLSHEAYIRNSTCLLFTSASSFPLYTICFTILHLLILCSSIHLPLVISAKATKHIDDLFMLGNPSSPLMTVWLSLFHTHMHTQLQSVSLRVCLSVKLHVTVTLNGVSSLLLCWDWICVHTQTYSYILLIPPLQYYAETMASFSSRLIPMIWSFDSVWCLVFFFLRLSHPHPISWEV